MFFALQGFTIGKILYMSLDKKEQADFIKKSHIYGTLKFTQTLHYRNIFNIIDVSQNTRQLWPTHNILL